ncbi:hypothetical protein ABZY05_43950 [Streptomyces canus]|uniref:hypothetical protein n=1 Tax=Streptomyces canus TaxID=58343 RepID=UPI0033AAC381
MGSFFKECEHPTQDRASERLLEIYNAKKAAPRGQVKAEWVAKYGAMRFGEYAAEWKAGQRDLGPASVRHLDSLLSTHLLPLLGSRRMETFDHKVVEGFIQTMERNAVGLAAQSNAFDKLKAILLDAHRLGPIRWPASSRRSTTPSAW